MKVQAPDSKGDWKDIAYLPISWRGNGYYTLALEPKYFWTFITSGYTSDYKIKLRIGLKYIDPAGKSETSREQRQITVYSNVYDAKH